MIREDKATLSHQRAELVTSLAGTLSPEDRVRIQGELSVINAKIKALNTTQAAQFKAIADQRKVAGIAEAQANATRAQTRARGGLPQNKSEEHEEDPGQTATIDAWIDAVLLRHDVDFTRSRSGKITFNCSPEWAAVLEVLVTGIYATAQGQELPDLSSAQKSKKTTKPKKR
jgi:hypothetical protein